MLGHLSLELQTSQKNLNLSISIYQKTLFCNTWSLEQKLSAKKSQNNVISFLKAYNFTFDITQGQQLKFLLDANNGQIQAVFEVSLLELIIGGSSNCQKTIPELKGTLKMTADILNSSSSSSSSLSSSSKHQTVSSRKSLSSKEKDKLPDQNLDIKILIRKSDKLKKVLKTNIPTVFYEIFKKGANKKEYEMILRSTIRDTYRDPIFKKIKTSLEILCNLDSKSKIKLVLYQVAPNENFVGADSDSNQSTLRLSQFENAMNIRKSRASVHSNGVPDNSSLNNQINDSICIKKLHEIKIAPKLFLEKEMFALKESGAEIEVQLERSKILNYKKFSNIDLKIHFAFDFGANNGHIYTPNSYHYIGGEGSNSGKLSAMNSHLSGLNPYQKVMVGIYQSLQGMVCDNSIGLYGFSGSKDPNQNSKYGFSLQSSSSTSNSDSQNQIKTIEQALNLYTSSAEKMTMLGPTRLGPTISNISKQIKNSGSSAQDYKINSKSKRNNYHFVVILTNGEVTDVSQTIDAILENIKDPVSFLVLGVGTHTFVECAVLDGNEYILTNSTKTITSENRVNVGFVRMEDYLNVEGQTDIENLMDACVADLPGQMAEYFGF